MANFTSIKASIAAKLSTITELQAVFGYAEREFTKDGFPVAIATPSDNSSDYLTTKSNERIYAFRIFFYQEEDTVGTEQAELILCHVIDAALDAFEQDITLGGTVLFTEPVPTEWGQMELDQGGNLLIATMTIRVHEAVNC